MAESRSLLRLRFETVGSIMAIVVGVAALFISWDQGKVMREEVRASVWPALQIDGFVDRSGGSDQVSMGLNVHNAGVGPALIESVRLHHQGVLVTDLDVLTALFPEGADRSASTLTGRILAAGDAERPFVFHFTNESYSDAVEIMSEVADDWAVEVCYCSALGECWTSSPTTTRPEPTRTCPTEDLSDL